MTRSIEEISEIYRMVDHLTVPGGVSYDAARMETRVAALFTAHIINGTPIEELRAAVAEKQRLANERRGIKSP